MWFLGDDQLKKHPVYIPCTIEDAYIFYLADLANWQIGLKARALRYFDYDISYMYSCPTGRDEDDWSDEKKRGSTGVEILMYRSTKPLLILLQPPPSILCEAETINAWSMIEEDPLLSEKSVHKW